MPAGLARRLIGYAIDCVILFVSLLGLQALLSPINPILGAMRDGAAASAGQLHL